MHLLRGILPCLFLTLALIGQAQSPDGTNAGREALRTRAHRTLADTRCQTSLPDDPGPAEERPVPKPPKPSGSRSASRDEPDVVHRLPRLPDLRAPANLAEFVLWLAVATATAVLVVMIVRALRSRRETVAKPVVLRAGAVPLVPAVEPLLPDHARLAQAGDFAAAIHALLQNAFAALSRRTGVLPVHATGREVLRGAAQQRVPTAALAPLVQAVEWLHFGGRPATRQHYEESVRHFEEWEAQCTPSP